MPAPQSVIIEDDKLNWEALWNATKNDSEISRSDDENIFDQIVRINARERGTVKFILFYYYIYALSMFFIVHKARQGNDTFNQHSSNLISKN